MSTSDAPTVAWFVQTAGSAMAHGYRWHTVGPAGDPTTPSHVMKEEVAGRTLLDLVPEDTPSIVLGRLDDGRRVLVVGGMRPSGAPAKGDYMHRPILATLLGVAAAGADPTPLLTAAAAALKDTLADTLPVSWTDEGGPVVDTPGTWAPSGTAASNGTPNLTESVAVPEGDRATVAAELGAVRPDLLTRLQDRPLLIATDMVDLDDLRVLRPWRAVTATVQERTELAPATRPPVENVPVDTAKERDHQGSWWPPNWLVVAGFALAGGLAVLAWYVATRILGRG